MGTRFRPYDPDQLMLLPPDLKDWLPEDHLAHQVSELVDALDLSKFYQPYEGDGRRNSPFDPRMMIKVILYGYTTGVFSSRKLARKIIDDVAFRMLAAGNTPKHRTICDFRKVHLKAFTTLLLQVVLVAREMGFVQLGQVAVDGTKVRANASKRKAMSYGRMGPAEQKLKAEIDELMAKAEAVNAQEDAKQEAEPEGDGIPEALKRRQDRLAAIQAAKERLEAQAREFDDARGRKPDEVRNPKGGVPYKRAYGEPEEKAQSNFTDPESRIMKTSTEGFQQCYNAQVAVDGESQLVVGTVVTNNASDQGQLFEVVDSVRDLVGEDPREVLADAGYNNEADLALLEERGIEGYVAHGRESGGKAKPKPVESEDSEPESARDRMAEKLATDEGLAVYARRKWMVEAPIGWIKEAMGFRRFSLRGLEGVRGEWDLVCLALNVRRLHVLKAA